MKERKYKEDWVNETRFDEKGREKRVPVYRGEWFRLSPEQAKRKLQEIIDSEAADTKEEEPEMIIDMNE
jgi:hypothetical protein